jgi:hypothetical protein
LTIYKINVIIIIENEREVNKMENFIKLKNLLLAMNVVFTEISKNEIAIPNPVDIGFLANSRSMIEIIEDNKVCCITDEGFIHIMYDEKNDFLNFLTVVPKEVE